MRSRIYIVILIAVLTSSCGEYQELLKSTDYDLKKTKAREYFEAKQYVKSSELLEQIVQRYRATDEAEELNWLLAQSFYGMRQYDIAGTGFKSIVDQYPYGKFAEQSAFLGAKCDYNMSPKAELDQEYTKNAIDGFKVFVTRFPSSTQVPDAKKLIKELEERLVEKSYLNARLYYDMTEYKSAITALSNSLKEYSDTKYREEMMYLKLSSLYLYAEKSYVNKQRERYQAALDDYFSFVEEFPESRFSGDVKKIYESTARYLKLGETIGSESTGK